MAELDHGRITLCGKVRCLGRYRAQCTSNKGALELGIIGVAAHRSVFYM